MRKSKQTTNIANSDTKESDEVSVIKKLQEQIKNLQKQVKEKKEESQKIEFVVSVYKEHQIIYRKNGNYYEKIASVKKIEEFLTYLDQNNGILILGELDFKNKENAFLATGKTKIDL